MLGRRGIAVVTLITAGLLLLGQAPAFAPFDRAAAEAINVTEACPKYLSLEVASMAPNPGPQGPTVTIQAYSPPPSATSPGRLVLNRTIPVRPVDPPLTPLQDEPEEQFPYHGRAVLRWDVGRLTPGTRVFIGPPGVFEDPPQAPPIERVISSRCKTPRLRLTPVRSTQDSITWRVLNRNSFPVDFNAEVFDTDPAQVRIGTVPAGGEAFFETTRVTDPNIALLFVGGKLVDVKVAPLQ
jgi:hypothetical protein